MRHSHHLSRELHDLAEICKNKKIELGELFELISTRSHGLLTFILALPFLLPIPLPGFSIMVGLMIAIIGFFMAINRPPWIPKKWMRFKINPDFLQKIFKKAKRLTLKIEKLIRPRGLFLSSNQFSHIVSSIMIMCCGILLALPLPPGTNFPPASAIIILSLAMLERDGLLLVFGYIVFSINIALFGGILFFGFEAVMKFWEKLHHFS